MCCCHTWKLANALKRLKGISNSVLVHVILKHLGSFVWEHKMIGALSEEGIEATHAKLATELKKHKSSPMKAAKQALSKMAIDVLLEDRGRMSN